VNDAKCRGYTNCVVAAPDVFAMDPRSGHAMVLDHAVPASDVARMRKVARLCPAKAIELTAQAEPADGD
jgi:ferredoxin